MPKGLRIATGYPTAVTMVNRPHSNTLVPLAVSSVNDELKLVRITSESFDGETAAVKVARQGSASSLGRGGLKEEFIPDWALETGYRSGIAAPIIRGMEILGAVYVLRSDVDAPSLKTIGQAEVLASFASRLLSAGTSQATAGSPTPLNELLTRAGRGPEPEMRPPIELPHLSLDPAKEKLVIGGVAVSLSRTEFSMLYALAKSAGNVVFTFRSCRNVLGRRTCAECQRSRRDDLQDQAKAGQDACRQGHNSHGPRQGLHAGPARVGREPEHGRIGGTPAAIAVSTLHSRPGVPLNRLPEGCLTLAFELNRRRERYSMFRTINATAFVVMGKDNTAGTVKRKNESDITYALKWAAWRWLRDEADCKAIAFEVRLEGPSGRIADVVGVGPENLVYVVEVKSSRSDAARDDNTKRKAAKLARQLAVKDESRSVIRRDTRGCDQVLSRYAGKRRTQAGPART